jgi:hypothetical protein
MALDLLDPTHADVLPGITALVIAMVPLMRNVAPPRTPLPRSARTRGSFVHRTRMSVRAEAALQARR